MMGERVALLVGLLVVPALLLWLGHGFRSLSLRMRRIFWGGVIGHSVAMAATLLVMMAPPVWWHDGGFLRDFAVHWTLLLGGVVGVIVGLAYHSSREAEGE